MLKKIISMQFLIINFYCLKSYENSEMPYLQKTPSQEVGSIVDIQSTSFSNANAVLNLFMKPNQYITRNSDAKLQISGYVACAIGLYKIARDCVVYNQRFKQLSYHEFLKKYPCLLEIEKQIACIQDLLCKSCHGTFPEKVASRIALVRLSLASPYDKIMNQCSQNYFNANFNECGEFVWHEKDDAEMYYKKFYRKIPQDFRKLTRCAKNKKISQMPKYAHISSVAERTENVYNQTLLDIVYAGMSENYPLLKKLCRTYYDKLFEKLYQYYIDQKMLRHDRLYQNCQDVNSQSLMSNFNDQDACEEVILREWYSNEIIRWLFPLQSYDKSMHEVVCSLLSKDQILQMPFNPNDRFLLLKNCLDTICLDDTLESKKFDELFLPCGILKKYKSHAWLPSNLNDIYLHDIVMRKAVNFSLAICEKEYDETTQQVAKRLLEYVFCAYRNKDEQIFMVYKNKIVVLYEALSYKRYDLNILKI